MVSGPTTYPSKSARRSDFLHPSQSLLATAQRSERRLAAGFDRVPGPQPTIDLGQPVADVLAPFGVTERHTGESFDDLLEVAAILRHEPDLSLFVQANPAFCYPSLVSEAMAARIQERTGVPVVAVTYDGSPTPKNDVIVPYLAFARPAAPRQQRGWSGAPASPPADGLARESRPAPGWPVRDPPRVDPLANLTDESVLAAPVH